MSAVSIKSVTSIGPLLNQSITIAGSGFGSVDGGQTFDGSSASTAVVEITDITQDWSWQTNGSTVFTSWTDGKIVFTSNDITGDFGSKTLAAGDKISVVVENPLTKTASTPHAATVSQDPTHISSVSTLYAMPTQTVVVTGTGLGSSNSGSAFNGPYSDVTINDVTGNWSYSPTSTAVISTVSQGEISFSGTISGDFGSKTFNSGDVVDVVVTNNITGAVSQIYQTTVSPSPTHLTSVTGIQSGQSQSFTIAGTNFGGTGTASGQSSAVTIADLTNNWSWNSNSSTVFSTFTDSQISFSGTVNGDFGSKSLQNGDVIDVTVTNGKTGAESQTYQMTVGSTAPVVPSTAGISAPTLAAQTSSLNWTTGKAETTTLPSGTFTDPQGESLTTAALQANGQSLPSWLSFDPTTDTLSGTAPAGTKTLSVEVIATNSSGVSNGDVFSIAFGTSSTAAARHGLLGVPHSIHGDML